MQIVLLILQLLLLGFALCLLVISYKWAPYVPSGTTNLKQVLQELNLSPKKTFVDVGSGDGRVVRIAQSLGFTATGIEINPFLVHFCRLVNLVTHNKSTFILGNFLNLDLQSYSVVYFYLLPNLITQVVKKPQVFAPQTILISYVFQVPGWQPYKVVGKYYIYKT